jgi:hypothetical protein
MIAIEREEIFIPAKRAHSSKTTREDEQEQSGGRKSIILFDTHTAMRAGSLSCVCVYVCSRTEALAKNNKIAMIFPFLICDSRRLAITAPLCALTKFEALSNSCRSLGLAFWVPFNLRPLNFISRALRVHWTLSYCSFVVSMVSNKSASETGHASVESSRGAPNELGLIKFRTRHPTKLWTGTLHHVVRGGICWLHSASCAKFSISLPLHN